VQIIFLLLFAKFGLAFGGQKADAGSAAPAQGSIETPAAPAAPRTLETPAAPGIVGTPATSASQAEEPGTRRSFLGISPNAIHERLEQSILKQTVRLDNFFGSSDPENRQKTGYLLRWRNSLRVDQKGDLQLGSAVRMDLSLSRISNRLHLSITGENEPDPLAPRLPEDPGNPGFDRTFPGTTRVVNTELRYDLLRNPTTDLFMGAGVKILLPPEAFVRGRFQHIHNIDDLSLIRFAETLFLKTPDGLGETTEFSVERALNPKMLLRWANSGTLSQEFDGLEWGSELSLTKVLNLKSAVTVMGGIYSNTSQDDWVHSYKISTRYRRNFLTDWLYCELEPEVSWTRSTENAFETIFAINLRLEVVFQGKEQKIELK
jgi:hypothetical protein